MPELAVLLLNNTGITEFPPGLLQLEFLDLVDLSANAIIEVPSDILELPMEIGESLNLRGNPLSEDSLRRLFDYFRLNNVDFRLDEIANNAQLEVSSSGNSEVDE
jgi:hypothetical protein